MYTIKNKITYTPPPTLQRTGQHSETTTTTSTPLQQQFQDKQNKVEEKQRRMAKNRIKTNTVNGK